MSGLADVATSVAAQQEALAQTLHVTPNAISNLYGAYHKKQNAVAAAVQLANVTTPAQLICGAIGGAGNLGPVSTMDLCRDTLGPLLGALMGDPDKGTGLLGYLLSLVGDVF